MHAVVLFVAVFLAAAVEVVEMVTIILGVGLSRGWRATAIGGIVGFALLALVVAVLGATLTLIPIDPLRVLIGTLLLLFGLQWLRKPTLRLALYGLAGPAHLEADESEDPSVAGFDWTAFALSFKGVVLEGLEVIFIVVTFGVATGDLTLGIVAAVAAFLIVGGAGALAQHWIRLMPRQVLKLVVGLLLTSYGTFWAGEGLGATWPLGDLTILVILAGYSLLVALGFVAVRRSLRPSSEPGALIEQSLKEREAS